MKARVETGSEGRRLGLGRILVPLDFSRSSLKALAYAIPMARRFGSGITLLHVAPSTIGGQFLPAAALERFARKRLGVEAERVKARGVPCEGLVCSGNPFLEIVRCAAKTGADLIVLSTRGNTGWKRALLGSVAERVVRHAGCPVLVVRRRERSL